MADTAKRLAGPALITATTSGTAQTLYTVPASATTIVRHIIVTNNENVARTITISIGADAAGTRIFSGTLVPANGVVSLTGSIVLSAAETLRSFASVASQIVVTASGVEVV